MTGTATKGGSRARAPLLDEQLCFALYGAAHAMGRAYAPLLAPMGLTYPQYLVLLALWEEDGLALHALGERLDLDSGTLTPLVKRIEAAGLVVRARDPDDERRVRVSLTEQGQRLRRPAAELPRRIAQASGLDPAALAEMRDHLLRLRDALGGE